MEFPPCVLCWYQRIAMYPLVFIFLIGSFHDIKSSWIYSLPLVITGWVIAVYHNLIHYEIIPENLSPCLEGVSCATVYINWFGFITIPLLSFMAFSTLGILLLLLKRNFSNEK
jgi:disulfide bond formation protein DsbB